MGSCLGTKTSENNGGDLELSVRSRSPSKSPDLGPPEPVQDLTAQQVSNGAPPSHITLTWRPPENFSRPNDVSHYYIKVSSKISNKILRELEVQGSTTEVELEALEPLQTYILGVQAMGRNRVTGDWNMIETFIDWHCRFPTCERNRMRFEDGVYDFCSRDHKVAFDDHHCLYKDCTERATFVPSPKPISPIVREKSHFCGHDHFYRILKTESGVQHGFFLEVQPGSVEHKTVEDHFRKKWSSSLKQIKTPPSLRLVLAIFNPSLNEKFERYKEINNLDREKATRLVKKLYYGTDLLCDLYTYQIPCKHGDCKSCTGSCSQGEDRTSSSSCGVCELAVHGFERRLSGVSLNKNPAESHSKATMHMDSLTYALLMCDVACVNSKSYKRRASDNDMRPEGFDTVKILGRSRSLIKQSTDEVKVFKPDAICPRYILLYV